MFGVDHLNKECLQAIWAFLSTRTHEQIWISGSELFVIAGYEHNRE